MGPFGEGETFEAALPVGTHVVTLAATDAEGNLGEDILNVVVECPLMDVRGPSKGHARGRRTRPILLVAILLLFGGSAAAQNLAPLARATVSADEAFVDDSFAFSGASSVDPEGASLSFLWDFGDGTASTEPEPAHAFLDTGPRVISLLVSDGQLTSLATLNVFVLAPPSGRRSASSAPLAVLPDATVVVVNPDAGSLSFVDVAAGLVEEVPVCLEPRSVAASADGALAYVACGGSGELVVLDALARAELRRIVVGHTAYAVAVASSGSVVVVGGGTRAFVAELDIDGSTLLRTTSIGAAGEARALAIPSNGATAFVPLFLSRGIDGGVALVALGADDPPPAIVPLVVDASPFSLSSGPGTPNLLRAAVIDPAERFVWIGGQKSNTATGLFNSEALLTPESRVRGLAMKVALDSTAEVVERRIDTNDADSASGLAFSPSGRYAFVAHAALGAVSVYDVANAELFSSVDGNTVPFVARVSVGDLPTGLALSSDGTTLYVACELARTLVILDVSDPRTPSVIDTITVAQETLPAEVLLGKKIFHRSTAPVHSSQGYIACASCHPGGAHDGRTWDFTQAGEGLRNTIDMRGRAGTAHGPVHWSANFDEIQDFENDIVNGFGGSGLAADGAAPNAPLSPQKNAGRSPELDALAAYAASLTTPPRSPFPLDDAGAAAAARGREVFLSQEAACATCHPAPTFTDSVLTADPADFVLHDVGTIGVGSGERLRGPLVGLDTPSLLGVWQSAPYLHDGSAPTLEEVLTTRNADDAHGTTSTLAATDIADLVEYLRSLDGVDDELRAPEAPGPDAGTQQPTPDGCGCRTTSSPALVLSLLALFSWKRWRRS